MQKHLKVIVKKLPQDDPITRHFRRAVKQALKKSKKALDKA